MFVSCKNLNTKEVKLCSEYLTVLWYLGDKCTYTHIIFKFKILVRK